MKIRSALITPAGFGTRCLPITKTIQKEMLPILNRPLIDYVVDDLIMAGVEQIIIVISEHNSQVLHFYRENQRLVEYLDRHGKQYLYSQVERLHTKAEFIFVRQPDEGEYGTAVPLKLAQEHLQDEEAFFVFMGDDFLFGNGQSSESANMLKLYQDSGASGLMTCITKPAGELSRYGVIKSNQRGQNQFLESIVEKPSIAEAPSNLINVSKYIMTPEVFDLVKSQKVDPKSGELYITDTLINWAKTKPVVIYQPEGEYLDGGNPEEWLKANIIVASSGPKLKQLMVDWLK